MAGCKSQADKEKTFWYSYSLHSPDGQISAHVSTEGELEYSVTRNGAVIVTNSPLGLKFKDGADLGRNIELLGVDANPFDTHWRNPFGKNSVVRNH